jgi:hypothetical protein
MRLERWWPLRAISREITRDRCFYLNALYRKHAKQVARAARHRQ